MNRKTLAGLVALNLALLVALGAMTLTAPSAKAQLGRVRSHDYVMVAADIPGRRQDAVFIADVNNAAMIAVTFQRTAGGGRLVPIGIRNLARDFQQRYQGYQETETR